MQTEIEIDMLERIVKSVFITMLDLEVTTSEFACQPALSRLTSFVQMTGDWNGAMLLECSPRQACLFAGRILSMDPPYIVDDDVRDALGELANVIGGNMKCGMSAGVRLSMPTVMDGTDYDLRLCGTNVLERICFECCEGHFWVTILFAGFKTSAF
jgi:chemotaxis protein CheX